MDEELRPRINKLNAEKSLYDDFIRMGNDVENLQHTLYCIQYYTCARNVDKYTQRIAEKNEEQENRSRTIEELNQQLEEANRELAEMEEMKNVSFFLVTLTGFLCLDAGRGAGPTEGGACRQERAKCGRRQRALGQEGRGAGRGAQPEATSSVHRDRGFDIFHF